MDGGGGCGNEAGTTVRGGVDRLPNFGNTRHRKLTDIAVQRTNDQTRSPGIVGHGNETHQGRGRKRKRIGAISHITDVMPVGTAVGRVLPGALSGGIGAVADHGVASDATAVGRVVGGETEGIQRRAGRADRVFVDDGQYAVSAQYRRIVDRRDGDGNSSIGRADIGRIANAGGDGEVLLVIVRRR